VVKARTDRGADSAGNHRLIPIESVLAPLRPGLIYFTQPDARAYLEHELIRRMGE